MNGKNKSIVLVLIVIFGLMILGCSILSKQNQGKSDSSSQSQKSEKDKLLEKEKAFDTKKEQFTKLPEKVQLTQEPYLRGKLVYLTQSGNYWDFQNNLGSGDRGGIHQKKIKDLIAQAPDEVTTVVLKPQCQSVRKGDYKVSGKTVPSFIEKCELTIIDTTIPAVIYRKKMEGKLDGEETVMAGSVEVVGRVYDEEIYTYLASLPRK